MSDQTKADALSDDARRVLLCMYEREKAGRTNWPHEVSAELGWGGLRVAEAFVELTDSGFIGGGDPS